MKFLHTANLQIGMTASSVGKLAKQLREAWIESLRAVLRLGSEKQVNFVVIAGDMFETNRISKKNHLQSGSRNSLANCDVLFCTVRFRRLSSREEGPKDFLGETFS